VGKTKRKEVEQTRKKEIKHFKVKREHLTQKDKIMTI